MQLVEWQTSESNDWPKWKIKQNEKIKPNIKFHEKPTVADMPYSGVLCIADTILTNIWFTNMKKFSSGNLSETQISVFGDFHYSEFLMKS